MHPKPPMMDSPPPSVSRFPIAHPLLWFTAFALAHMAVRVTVSPALKWDEAEQILWSQQLALGYGAQPPLYTWLQWGVNQLLGPSVLSLAVLKHSLMAAAYVFMWLAGRELLGPRGAWWASASMILMPVWGWESIKDYTHTVLETTIVCCTWWLLLRLLRRPSPPRVMDFALLGLLWGCGILSKYSFALVLFAMLLAALSVPEARRTLLARGWWWAPLLGALLVLPHAIWFLGHTHEATTETLGKMELHGGHQLWRGLGQLLQEVVLNTLLQWALLALWAFGWAAWRTGAQAAVPWIQQVFRRYVALVLLALLGMVVLAGVSNFIARWLLPLLCMLPLAAFAGRPQLQQHPRADRYTIALVLITFAVLFAASTRTWSSAVRTHPRVKALANAARPWFPNIHANPKPDELNQPVVELAAALRSAGYDGRSSIIAADHILGGTLRTRFAQAPVAICATYLNADVANCVAREVARAQAAGRGWLLVSREDKLEPDWWAKALSRLPTQAEPHVQSVRLPYLQMPAETPPAHYRFVWRPAQAWH